MCFITVVVFHSSGITLIPSQVLERPFLSHHFSPLQRIPALVPSRFPPSPGCLPVLTELSSSSSPRSHLFSHPGPLSAPLLYPREGPGLSSFLSHKRPLCFPPLCCLRCLPTPFLNTPVVHSLPLPRCIPYSPRPAEEYLRQRRGL